MVLSLEVGACFVAAASFLADSYAQDFCVKANRIFDH